MLLRGVITVGTASAVFGGIWRYLAVFGGIWRYLAVFGGIWRYLAVFGGIWRYLAVFGGIWRYLAVFGGIWRYLVFVCFMRHVSRAVVYGRRYISITAINDHRPYKTTIDDIRQP